MLECLFKVNPDNGVFLERLILCRTNNIDYSTAHHAVLRDGSMLRAQFNHGAPRKSLYGLIFLDEKAKEGEAMS